MGHSGHHASGNQQSNSKKPETKEKNKKDFIVTVVIISWIVCGLIGLIWFWICSNSGPNGTTSLLALGSDEFAFILGLFYLILACVFGPFLFLYMLYNRFSCGNQNNNNKKGGGMMKNISKFSKLKSCIEKNLDHLKRKV